MFKTVYVNEETRTGRKSIDLPQFPDDAWEWYSNKPAEAEDEILARVAAVYAGIEMTKNGAASIPFVIQNKRGDEIDNSEDWQNKVGWLPNPDELIKLWVESRLYTNRAYGFVERKGRTISLLRYIAPASITIEADDKKGITGFTRKVGTTSKLYKVEENIIFYHFKLDHTTEIIPNDNTAVRALAASAGILYFSDYFVAEFFKGGGIKPTMLLVKNATNPAQIEKLENVWEKFTKGMWRTIGKVFEKDSVEPHTIGEGIKELRGTELYDKALRNVCLALGIPQSVMLQDAANYATAMVYQSSWYSNTLVPMMQELTKDLNEQVFTPAGYNFKLQPHQAEPDKEEEVQRAGAYASYINAGMKPSIAAQIVGLDLPEDMEPEELDPEQPEEPTVPLVTPEPSSQPATLSWAQYKDLHDWHDIARRKAKRGEPLPLDFTSKELPAHITEAVRESLRGVVTLTEIDAVFENAVTTPAPVYEREDSTGTKELAASLNALADAVMTPQLTPIVAQPSPSITVNTTSNMADELGKHMAAAMAGVLGELTVAMKAMVIESIKALPTPVTTVEGAIINLPEMVTNVTVPEQKAADIVITPQINFPKPKRHVQTVKRDSKGEISGSETVIEYEKEGKSK